MSEFQPKPLEVVDGRIPCPKCQTPSDLTDEVLIVHLPGRRIEKPLWECPECRERFADGKL